MSEGTQLTACGLKHRVPPSSTRPLVARRLLLHLRGGWLGAALEAAAAPGTEKERDSAAPQEQRCRRAQAGSQSAQTRTAALGQTTGGSSTHALREAWPKFSACLLSSRRAAPQLLLPACCREPAPSSADTLPPSYSVFSLSCPTWIRGLWHPVKARTLPKFHTSPEKSFTEQRLSCPQGL